MSSRTDAVLFFSCVGRASANSIMLSDVQVQLDPNLLTASISASLEAHVDPGNEVVFLDGLGVSLWQDGNELDLFSGTTRLNDGPFFANTPVSMMDFETTAPLVLFQLEGLLPGSLYTGLFYLIEGGTPLESPGPTFSFTIPQPPSTSVPEPSSLWLFASGACVVMGHIRRRRSA